MVWHMISTAYVHCPACDLVRSFDGDTDHRKFGHCGLVGTNELAHVGKGKARAIDL